MRLAPLLGFGLWLCLQGTAYAAGPIEILKIQVDCSGDDSIGSQVCYAVKEKIRASEGFELIDTAKPIPGTFRLSLVTIETDSSDTASAISEVITGRDKDGDELYLEQYVSICGADRVDYIANGIIADIEQQTEFMRK
jgi:hypothetical protein